jgi:hypothetical protein
MVEKECTWDIRILNICRTGGEEVSKLERLKPYVGAATVNGRNVPGKKDRERARERETHRRRDVSVCGRREISQALY